LYADASDHEADSQDGKGGLVEDDAKGVNALYVRTGCNHHEKLDENSEVEK
jgi:hypothetical protein